MCHIDIGANYRTVFIVNVSKVLRAGFPSGKLAAKQTERARDEIPGSLWPPFLYLPSHRLRRHILICPEYLLSIILICAGCRTLRLYLFAHFRLEPA